MITNTNSCGLLLLTIYLITTVFLETISILPNIMIQQLHKWWPSDMMSMTTLFIWNDDCISRMITWFNLLIIETYKIHLTTISLATHIIWPWTWFVTWPVCNYISAGHFADSTRHDPIKCYKWTRIILWIAKGEPFAICRWYLSFLFKQQDLTREMWDCCLSHIN